MARVSAVVLTALAGLLTAELVTATTVEAYDVVLVGSVVAGATLTAWRAWSSSSFEVRLAAAALGVVTVVGQSLASTVGGPGMSQPHWNALAVAVALTGALALAVAALIAPARSPARRSEHPYAL